MKQIAAALLFTLFATAALAQQTVTGPNASTVGDIATFNNTLGNKITDTPVLGAAHGGTGQASIPAHGVPIGQGTSSFNTATTGTPGAVLVDQGPGLDPQFKVLTGDFTCTASGVCSLSSSANVQAFGADPTGSTDSTGAFNAAVQAIPAGGRVLIPRGNYKLNSPISSISATGIQFQCESQQSTFLQRNFAAGNTISFSGAQFGSVRDCSFLPLVRPTSGYEISFGQGCFECEARSVWIQYGFNGIEIFNAAETRLLYVDLRYLFGQTGIYYHGNAAFGGSFGATLTKIVTDNPYPAGVVLGSTTWSTSTAYTTGQVVFVNGNIYQAGNNGTSAASGSGPAGLPSGTTPASAFANTITDGTVNWFYISSGVQWIAQDSYGFSLRCFTCALLDGLNGFVAIDGVNNGTSYPKFDFFDDIETDHTLSSGILLNAGVNFGFVNSWFGSSLSNNGIVAASNFKGELSILNSRIAANCQAGILLQAGVKNVIIGNSITSNSVCTSNLFNGVTVTAGVSQFTISNNFLGRDPDIAVSPQASGVNVGTGASDYYNIVNNICAAENVTSCVADGGSGTHKTVSGNN